MSQWPVAKNSYRFIAFSSGKQEKTFKFYWLEIYLSVDKSEFYGRMWKWRSGNVLINSIISIQMMAYWLSRKSSNTSRAHPLLSNTGVLANYCVISWNGMLIKITHTRR